MFLDQFGLSDGKPDIHIKALFQKQEAESQASKYDCHLSHHLPVYVLNLWMIKPTGFILKISAKGTLMCLISVSCPLQLSHRI